MELRGVYSVVPTPFDVDGTVDTDSLERLGTFVLQSGAAGTVVPGVMGEASKLSEQEHGLVIKTMRRALPDGAALVAGIQETGTRLAVNAACRVTAWGADALLLTPPPVQNDEVILEKTLEHLQRILDHLRWLGYDV